MKKICLFGAVVLSLILAGSGWGEVIDVPGIGNITLQDALDTAEINGKDDTINIAAGTYNTSTTTFSYNPAAGNNSLTIVGAGAGSTILDGGNSDQVMYIYTGGLGDDSNAHVTVSGITFQNGVASQPGAGLSILTELANVIVEDCEFSGNTAENFDGGGAYTSSGGDPSGDVTLRNNTFRNNTSSAMVGFFPRGGGAYGYSKSGALTFTNNIFNGNTAEYDGGGACGQSSTGTVTFTNNTFSGNDALNDGGGFLIILTVNSAGNIYNNIAWNNTATGNGGDICVDDAGATVKLYNNDYGPDANDFYIEVGGGSLSQADNINTDPLLVDDSDPNPSNWDLHLTDTSPCIDAGRATAPSLPLTDCDGEQRTSGSAPDIGADEVQSGVPPGDNNGGGGCFIATAAYGSALSNEVTIFKQFRDEFLLTNELGRSFVSAYYRYSPSLADRIAKHPMGRKMVRIGLYPILELSKWFVRENDSKQPSKEAE